MPKTDAEKKAIKKHQKKLVKIQFYFNKETEADAEIVEIFNNISVHFPTKKSAFAHLVKNETYYNRKIRNDLYK